MQIAGLNIKNEKVEYVESDFIYTKLAISSMRIKKICY